MVGGAAFVELHHVGAGEVASWFCSWVLSQPDGLTASGGRRGNAVGVRPVAFGG
jgi:hypothetical protein